MNNIRKLSFEAIQDRKTIKLYAGDIPRTREYQVDDLVGLSLNISDERHIKHDITKPYPLRDACVDIYQAEDVFEHIEYNMLPNVIDEIYRILKSGGIFRLSVPDYRCDILYNRSVKDINNNIVFDPEGGGDYISGRVVNGGHVWFPVYETVLALFADSLFSDWEFFHYYNGEEAVTRAIDYSRGYIQRTPDNDERVKNPYRPMSIVVDAYKY